MFKTWTFGQKIIGGFAVLVVITLLIGVVAFATLRTVVDSKDQVINVDSPLMLKAAQMQTSRQQLTSSFRNVMLSGDPEDITALQTVRDTFSAAIQTLKDDAAARNDAVALQLAGTISTIFAEHTAIVDQVIAMRIGEAPLEPAPSAAPATPAPTAPGTTTAPVDTPVAAPTSSAAEQDRTAVALAVYEEQGVPKGMALSQALTDYVTHRQEALTAAQQTSTDISHLGENIITIFAIVAALLAIIIATILARSLSQQIGGAVSHVQNSSAELQAAANQQATGVKEQVTSMNEINTTISELLATSRQIAESAQRVAQISERTTTAARTGDGTVERANDSISSIRSQVDLVVGHMLELGKKSQQIGAVLDIVSELAEQTNILSINATIEAAGAGESGRRFSVVADEIRKLADRVAGAAKEIRTLIDDIRSSVNTTVMATEIGSKAVDSGSRQFADVATVFKEIGKLVTTTTEAAREIELSTKQQATAVEQVNMAIANVAQATKETEASAGQTIQTATELASTSRDLLRLVRTTKSAA